MALPAYHLVRRAFPHAEICLLTNLPVHAKAPAAAAVLGDSGLVQGYLSYPVGLRNPARLARLLMQIRRFRPEVVIYLAALRSPSAVRRDEIFFRLGGARRIIGVPPGRVLTRYRIKGTGELEWESAALLRRLDELGAIDLNDPCSWDMRLTGKECAAGASAIAELGPGPILAVSVGTKMQSKDWGEANWTTLLQQLEMRLPQHRLALLGSAEEADLSHRASAAWAARRANFCGRLNPRESVALLRRAQLFVGHDSGPMHLAAAAGTKCVAIFSARNIPRVWFPYGEGHAVLYHETQCAGCELETCITERKKCILSITVEEVLDAVLKQITAHSRSPVLLAEDELTS